MSRSYAVTPVVVQDGLRPLVQLESGARRELLTPEGADKLGQMLIAASIEARALSAEISATQPDPRLLQPPLGRG